MERQHTYYSGEKDKDLHVAGMKKYVNQKQELDKILIKKISPLIEGGGSKF